VVVSIGSENKSAADLIRRTSSLRKEEMNNKALSAETNAAAVSHRSREPAMRSRDSRYYGKRFMMRLDPETWKNIEELSAHFDKSIAEIIRQLIA
jgi:hypothetical protein